MSRPRLLVLLGLAVLLAVGLAVDRGMSATRERASGERVLRLPAPVTQLAADGQLLTVTACGPGAYWFYIWNPVRRSARLVTRKWCGSGHQAILAQGIAGRRLAWAPYDAGNYTTAHLVTATVQRPRPAVRLTGDKVRNSDSGEGDSVGAVYGDGSLLVFNTWSACESRPEGGSCAENEGTGRGYHIYNENVWRVVGHRKRLVLASPDQATVLSVANGRILLQRADGSLELRRADGSLLRAFPFGPKVVRGAVLDASELVVLDRSPRLTWRVYDPVSGEQQRAFSAQPGAIPADVERGVLVYTVGRVVHAVRLADRRQQTFTTPRGSEYVLAQIEPSGLFYSYQVGSEGRVRFVPFSRIRFR